MNALLSWGHGTWVIAPLVSDIVGCRWVFTVKFRPDSTVDGYKTCPVAKGFTQTYRVDYFEILMLLGSIPFVPFFLLISTKSDLCFSFMRKMPSCEDYMKQPPEYVAQGENVVCKLKKAI